MCKASVTLMRTKTILGRRIHNYICIPHSTSRNTSMSDTWLTQSPFKGFLISRPSRPPAFVFVKTPHELHTHYHPLPGSARTSLAPSCVDALEFFRWRQGTPATFFCRDLNACVDSSFLYGLAALMHVKDRGSKEQMTTQSVSNAFRQAPGPSSAHGDELVLEPRESMIPYCQGHFLQDPAALECGMSSRWLFGAFWRLRGTLPSGQHE